MMLESLEDEIIQTKNNLGKIVPLPFENVFLIEKNPPFFLKEKTK